MVFIAFSLRVWLCLWADPRKLKCENVQNPTSARIATLENFPLYGMGSCMNVPLHLYRRKALEMWKQKRGSAATYNNLIKVFERAGYKNYAEIVQDLLNNVRTDTEESNKNTINQTPPPPLEQPSPQLPVFPSEYLESSVYAAAGGVKLLKEDYKLGTTEAINIPYLFDSRNCTPLVATHMQKHNLVGVHKRRP